MTGRLKRNYWKRNLIYVSPIVLGCLIQFTTAINANYEDKKTIISRSIEKTKTEFSNEGQQLYEEAIRQLETLEKTSTYTNSHANKISDQSYTDRIIQKILDLWYSNSQIPTTSLDKQQYHHKYKTVVSMLEQSAQEYHNNDALLLLAELNFFSKYHFSRNYHDAFNYFTELASRGNATAQQMIGFMYSTGIGHVVERDQAKALLYHTFAAHGGETTAEMTLGYRSLVGIGTDASCEDALYHYKNVANKIIDYYLSGPPGGHTLPPSKVRLSEEQGGVYGYTKSPDKSVSVEEIVQYWKYLAAKQEMDAQFMLGQVYYIGTRHIPRQFQEALYFFQKIVAKLDEPIAKITLKQGKMIGQAAGYLGMIHWRGEGVEVNEHVAHKWFQLGASLGDSTSQSYLGLMYLNGIVVHQQRDKALEYFKKSADQENPQGQVNLAIEYLQSDSTLQSAIRLFKKAAEAKHLLAYWYLALLNEQNLTKNPSCRTAVFYYKSIAEEGDWLDPTIEHAYAAYKNNDKENALLYYMLAAERGYEIAQSNVAYLLDEDRSMLKGSLWTVDNKDDELEKKNEEVHGMDKKESAFVYWTRSANQNNIDSRIKVGDYYFKGIGTETDFEKAVSCYRVAAETHASPMAFWNLGWMYENGIGVTKDFHLAKRAYDQALLIDPSAYLPVKLSLLKMYVRYYWEWITGHEVGPAFSSDDGAYPMKQQHIAEKKYDIGEEMERQYKLKKQKEREEQERRNEEGYFDQDFDGYEGGDGDDLFETALILSICLVVGYLVYVR